MKKWNVIGSLLCTLCLFAQAVFGVTGSVTAAAESGMVSDVLDVDYSTGSAENTAPGNTGLIAGTGNSVSFNPDLVLGKKVAVFDGSSGFGYQLTQETLDKIAGGYTLELMCKVNTRSNGAILGNMYGNKGFGLTSEAGGDLKYYQRFTTNTNVYRQCWYSYGPNGSEGYPANEWMHITISCNTSTGYMAMYINGVFYDSITQGATALDMSSDADQVLYIGGNSDAGVFSTGMKGSIAFVKMSSHIATPEEAVSLYENVSATMADMLCVDYSSGSADNLAPSGAQLVDGTGITAAFEEDAALDRTVASFDSKSGFGYRMTSDIYNKMNDGYTIEVLCKLSEMPNVTNPYGSAVVGCMNEGYGFGFMGTHTGYLDYWIAQQNSGGNYRQLYYENHSSTVPTDVWMHLLVTRDPANGTFYYYKNGVKQDYVSPTSMSFLEDPANILYVGGTVDSDGSFRIGMKGSVSYVKMYSSYLSADQATTLSANALSAGSSNPSDKTDKHSGSGGVFDGSFNKNDVIANIAVMSDTHIRTSSSPNDLKFVNSLIKAKALAGGSSSLNAVLIAGDLGESAPLQELPRLKSFLDANLVASDTELIPAIGNHDYYFQGAFSGRNSFRDLLGDYVYQNPVASNTEDQVTRGNYHTVINGIHFITVLGYDGNHGAADVAWLDAQLAEASSLTPDMPIIVLSHVQAQNTVIDDVDTDGSSRWYSTTIGPVLQKYPQAVFFAGHTHATPDIWNNGAYTAVGTGCLDTNMMFVQVDGDGNIAISVYPTSANINEMTTARKEWIFATPEAVAVAPSDSALAAAQVPAADILDVSFADGTTGDTAKNTAVINAGSKPDIIDNSQLGKKIASFNGTDQALIYNLSASQIASISDSMSMALTVRLNGKPGSGETVLFGNSRIALSYTSEGELIFKAASGDSDVILEAADVALNKWINVAVTYNGSEFRMYIDGLRVDKARAVSAVSVASEFGLGGNAASASNADACADIDVGSFRIYDKAMEAAEVYRMASECLNTRMVFSNANFIAIKGQAYTIPLPSAGDANNDSLEVTVTGVDKYGSALTIRNGKFTAYNIGDCTLTYRVNGLLVNKVVRVVTAEDNEAITVSLNTDKKTINKGETFTLVASTSVEGAGVTWTSSDASVAMVDANGVVTGVAAGKATITATLDNGSTASCVVTVVKKSNSTSPLTGDASSLIPLMAIAAASAGLLLIARRKFPVKN